MVQMKYAIWNNKGGVGKTFLSFAIGCKFAHEHPEKNIILIDMCPQANLSEIALGGNGAGAERLEVLLHKNPRQTIGGYFDSRINNPQSKTGSEYTFVIEKLSLVNPNVPENVHLVAGDPSLELQSQTMNQISAQTLPAESWANVHKWLSDMVEAIEKRLPNTVFFIDCNPSFATYTELALLASERLIVPCTADGSSARAVDNIGRLLYGVGVPVQYATANFSTKAEQNHMVLPKIHLISLNRSTQYSAKASHAFSAMFSEIKKRSDTLEASGKPIFSSRKQDRFLEIPAAHSVAVVCSHEGVPLEVIRLGPHEIHGETVQVNPEPLDRYITSITEAISKLN